VSNKQSAATGVVRTRARLHLMEMLGTTGGRHEVGMRSDRLDIRVLSSMRLWDHRSWAWSEDW